MWWSTALGGIAALLGGHVYVSFAGHPEGATVDPAGALVRLVEEGLRVPVPTERRVAHACDRDVVAQLMLRDARDFVGVRLADRGHVGRRRVRRGSGHGGAPVKLKGKRRTTCTPKESQV